MNITQVEKYTSSLNDSILDPSCFRICHAEPKSYADDPIYLPSTIS